MRRNHYHGSVTAKVLRATADVFKAKGYADAGYVFVNTDDVRMTHIALTDSRFTYELGGPSTQCWSQHGRGSDGRIQPSANFGNGAADMKNLSAYIHGLGLKFGICKWLHSLPPSAIDNHQLDQTVQLE